MTPTTLACVALPPGSAAGQSKPNRADRIPLLEPIPASQAIVGVNSYFICGRDRHRSGDLALFRRAQTRSARVHYLTVIASEQVDSNLFVSGTDRPIPGLTLPCHSLWHGSGTPAWLATR